jgi:hypothetical protein
MLTGIDDDKDAEAKWWLRQGLYLERERSRLFLRLRDSKCQAAND